jgi:hypothetical protein
MFKKTLIAMAVASVVAAPIASADVKISGVVEQTFTDTDNSGEGYTASTFNMLNITASEDFGNGMSAFAKYNMLTKAGTSTGETNGDQVVGLSSGFGTIVAGTMEDFTEGKLAAMVSMEGNGSTELAGNAGRTAGGLAYITPTVNGLHAGVAGYATADGTDKFDATDIAVFYDNGPLSVKVAQETLSKDMTTGAEEQTTTSVGASYAMGDMKVAVLHVGRDDQAGTAGADSDDTMFKGSYKMGNNTLQLGYADDDSAGKDITTVELIHKFSGRTSAYAGVTNNDVTGNDSTFVGMKHKF